MRCYWSPLIAMVFACVTFSNAEGGENDSTPNEEAVARLMRQLGSGRQRERDAASGDLQKLEEPALPLLRRALDDESPEIRLRARRIVASIMRAVDERATRALLAELDEDGFDRFVERMLTKEGFATEQRWKALDGFVGMLVQRASEVSGNPFQKPKLDMLKLPLKQKDLELYHTDDRVLMSTVPTPFDGTEGSVLICRGPLECTSLRDSIVIVDGDIKQCTAIIRCVVICRGHIRSVTGIDNSLIVATGEIESATSLRGNILQVAGVKYVTSSRNNAYLGLGEPRATDRNGNTSIPTDRGPLEMLKFSSGPRTRTAPK